MQGKECTVDDLQFITGEEDNIISILLRSVRFADIRFIDILAHLELEEYSRFIGSFPHVNKLIYRASVIDFCRSHLYHVLL
jgi:hypothetical protein